MTSWRPNPCTPATYAQVLSFDPYRTFLHLVMVSGAGAGKTTTTNKIIVELVASPAKLRAVLPRELHGNLGPDERPGPNTTADDFLRTFGEQCGGDQHSVHRFSCTIKALKPTRAVPDGGPAQAPGQPPSDGGTHTSPFAEGSEFDYFDLERHGVKGELQAQLSRGWDEESHVEQVGNKYNLCRPLARGQEYGCFMPNGRGVHCTDRVQHVYMHVADTLDDAAFRCRWQLISREAANKQIHQVRDLLLRWGIARGTVAPAGLLAWGCLAWASCQHDRWCGRTRD